MARYVIFGAGAVGCVLGAQLHATGHDVVFIARGAQLEALQTTGLQLTTPSDTFRYDVAAVAGPSETDITEGDRIFLCMKTQHTAAALEALAAIAPPETSVLCAQNGVASEAAALRHFDSVYGVHVFVVSTYLSPGLVTCYTAPYFGVLDVGRATGGQLDLSEAVAQDLRLAGFDAQARSDIWSWKYGKLITNTANILHAACADLPATADLERAARLEAELVLRTAQLPFTSEAQRAARLASILPLSRVDGRSFPGGSSWQSLARSTGDIETDYLNGEIVRLGRKHGVPTPINLYLQQLSRRILRDRLGPGAIKPAEIRMALRPWIPY